MNSRQGQVQNGLYRQLTAKGVKLRGQQDVYPYLLDLIGDASGMQGNTPLRALVAPFAGTIE